MLDPELNASSPLLPSTPPLLDRIFTRPLLAIVPSPASNFTLPPLDTRPQPECTKTVPPNELVPAPTLRWIFPPRPPVEAAEPSKTAPLLLSLAEPELYVSLPLMLPKPPLALEIMSTPLLPYVVSPALMIDIPPLHLALFPALRQRTFEALLVLMPIVNDIHNHIKACYCICIFF